MASERLFAATWRRERGEFEHSASLHQANRRTALWIGQAVSSDGDCSAQVISGQLEARHPWEEASQINGPFVGVVIEESQQSAVLCVDRYGHYPVYFFEDDSVTIAATDITAVLALRRDWRLNTTAVNLFMHTGELLDQMTLVAGVTFLTGGHKVYISQEGSRRVRYWRLRIRPMNSIRFCTAVAESQERLTQAVARLSKASASVGVPLSGGLDSRLILSLCAAGRQVPSFTLGSAGCRDIRYGARVAEALGSPHVAIVWEPERFPPLWRDGVEATAGSFGITEMFMLPYAERFGRSCDIVLNGLAGDLLLGGNLCRLRWMTASDLSTAGASLWRWRVSEENEQWGRLLLGESDAAARSYACWQASLSASNGASPSARLFEWVLMNRIFRFTNCGTQLLRRELESHAPFFDNDLIDFIAQVPLHFRYKHRLFLSVLRNVARSAARVPWQRTGLPPAAGFVANVSAMVAHRLIMVSGRLLKRDWLRSMQVAHTEEWLRSESWAGASRVILLSDRSLSRGVFSPDALRKLIQQQQAGKRLGAIVGRVLAIELFCRAMERHQGGLSGT